MCFEGIEFWLGVNVGVDISVEKLCVDFDVVVLVGGVIVWCELLIFGCELEGVYQVMEFLLWVNWV